MVAFGTSQVWLDLVDLQWLKFLVKTRQWRQRPSFLFATASLSTTRQDFWGHQDLLHVSVGGCSQKYWECKSLRDNVLYGT